MQQAGRRSPTNIHPICAIESDDPRKDGGLAGHSIPTPQVATCIVDARRERSSPHPQRHPVRDCQICCWVSYSPDDQCWTCLDRSQLINCWIERGFQCDSGRLLDLDPHNLYRKGSPDKRCEAEGPYPDKPADRVALLPLADQQAAPDVERAPVRECLTTL
jgi:hypothetical protein